MYRLRYRLYSYLYLLEGIGIPGAKSEAIRGSLSVHTFLTLWAIFRHGSNIATRLWDHSYDRLKIVPFNPRSPQQHGNTG